MTARHSRSWRNLPSQKQDQRPSKPRQRSKARSLLFLLIKKSIPLLIVAILIGSSLLAGAFWWYSRELPDPENLRKRDVAQTTKIYDRTAEHILYEIHGEEKRTLVRLAELPDHVKWATIALEDKDFYQHGGFDLTGILRAMVKNLASGDLTGQGGSTLTQQLVKNAILTREKRVSRKIKELILAYQIEKKFTKDEILQLYLNEIPYGSNAYGIQSASHTFFGKDAQDLTISESALLASLPQAPSRLSPYGSHLEAMNARHMTTLKMMHDQGYIQDDEYKQAQDQELEFKPRIDKIEAPHFVFYIRELLSEKYGETMIEQGGLKVVTTLDYDLQKDAEKAVADKLEFIQANGGSNAALVAIDPKNGQILSMVGSHDFFNDELDGQVNVAIRPRQPGSSFKPMVYMTAFRKGYTPSTILYDVVTDFEPSDNKEYIPHNYDLEERGPVTIRQALQGSLNVPAVKALYLAGPRNVVSLAQELGYATLTDPDRYGLSLVLGGAEVKLLEHVAAYGVLANEGIKNPTAGVLYVETPDGEKLEEFEETPAQVLDAETTRLITDVLSDNQARAYVFGTDSVLQLGSRPVAAKTGTTNDYRDAWTIGYTPSIAVGVWVGNNDNAPMKRGSGGSVMAGPVWNQFIRSALSGTAVEEFNKPEEIITEKPILDGVGGERTIKIDKSTEKLATENTPLSMIEEKTFRDLHSILHFVERDNPRGEAPKNPAKDSQYEGWEAAILRWADENEITSTDEQPPTEEDDVHIPANKPSLTVFEPTANTTIASVVLSPSISASAPRGIARVEYMIDGLVWDVVGGSPYVRPLSMSRLGKGKHVLRITAFDDVDNQTTIEIPFTYEGPSIDGGEEGIAIPQSLSLTWLSPIDNSTIETDTFPLTLTVTVSNPTVVKRVNYYYTTNNRVPTFIDSTRNPETTNVTTTWRTAPAPGTYTLYANVVDEDNLSYRTDEVSVVVQ